jgi:hypothetical protein
MISLSTVLIVLWYRQLTLIVWSDIFIGIVDSSGIRITATPTIRQYDAGILETGALVNRLQLVPPHEKAFVSKSYCNKECLQRVGLCLTSWYVCRSIVFFCPLSWLITRILRVRQRMTKVAHNLLSLGKHLSLPPFFVWFVVFIF